MQRQIATFRIPEIAGLVGLVAALGGCAANGGDESLLVVKAVAPPALATGGVCTFTASADEAGLVHGALDVTSGFGYQIVAQVKSRITADTGQDDVRTIFLRGANVDLTFPDAATFSAQISDLQSKGLLHFMAPISTSLPPNGSIADVGFELIPAGVATELKTMAAFSSTVVDATFTIAGDLAGGNVSSQAFHYSVTLGNQNLIVDKGPCSAIPSSFVPHPGNVCYPGQDFVIDCCEDPSTARVCPAVGTGM
jgi:hypothetical protein